MSNCVWVSKAPSDSTLADGFTASDLQRDGDQRVIEISKIARQGGVLAKSELPSQIWGEVGPYRAHHFPGYWPEITYYSGIWVVSGAVAGILMGFDLGGGVIAPVRRFAKDQTRPVPGEWFCWNVGNQKSALIGERSQNLVPVGANKWLPLDVKDHDLKCSSEAMAGPEAWYDPQVQDMLFLSSELGQALIGSDLATEEAGFGQLIKVDVIEA